MKIIRRTGLRDMVPHYVYRCYDADDRLLYVGCTNSPKARLGSHAELAWWWPEVARVRNIVWPNREVALSKEREAILDEMPRCNVKGRWHKWDDRSHWAAQDYLDYLRAIDEAAMGLIGDGTRRLIANVEGELLDRFGVRDGRFDRRSA